MVATPKIKGRKIPPPLILLGSFLVAILCGTLLLMLPASTVDGRGAGLLTALFTATSAVCVTGLIVVDTGSFFSPFGQGVILLLIQLGGLGIMTFSVALTLLLGRKMSMREKVVFGNVLNVARMDFVGTLLKAIVILTLGIELVGAGILYLTFSKGMPAAKAAYFSLFHAVSAFCNAGFCLFPDSLAGFRESLPLTLTVMGLIVAGGLGFTVLLDLGQVFSFRKPRRFSFHTRLVITTSLFLIAAGAVLIFIFELQGWPRDGHFGGRVLGALFQSVTARTAGFNTLPIGSMHVASLFLLITFMFVGASPGGTGGGIKTSTFAIVVQFVRSVVRERDRVEIYRRTIPRRTVHQAVAIFSLGLLLIIFCVYLLLFSERNLPPEVLGPGLLVSVMFEATSAFGTVGLSMGVTPHLSTVGRLIIIFLMFAGRVGPLTLALALGAQRARTLYHYPETQIMVG